MNKILLHTQINQLWYLNILPTFVLFKSLFYFSWRLTSQGFFFFFPNFFNFLFFIFLINQLELGENFFYQKLLIRNNTISFSLLKPLFDNSLIFFSKKKIWLNFFFNFNYFFFNYLIKLIWLQFIKQR